MHLALSLIQFMALAKLRAYGYMRYVLPLDCSD